MRRYRYPSVDNAKEANKEAVENFRATKAERFEVLSESRIKRAINQCKKRSGTSEEKAACLLKSFSRQHPFGSANRRTGYLLMNQFLFKNEGYSFAKKKKTTSPLFKELRRRNVKEKEIIAWLKNKDGLS